MTGATFIVFMVVGFLPWHEEATFGLNSQESTEGPRFVKEPPGHVAFSNTTGTTVTCEATGQPQPRVEWILRDGKPVLPLPGIRDILESGSLVFPPFTPEEHRPDVHETVYICTASNTLGTIGSQEVRTQAFMETGYNIRVYDKTVAMGTTAVLNCYVPSFVSSYVHVTSWNIDDNVRSSAVSPFSPAGEKYVLYTNGDLHIHQVSLEDTRKTYRCKTKNLLNGEVKTSDNVARIIVINSKEDIAPIVTIRQHQVSVKSGKIVYLPCAAQGQPPPTYEWFKLKGTRRIRVHSWPILQKRHGSLKINRVKLDDEGRYLCVVNNSLGEDYCQVELKVLVPLQVRIEPHSLVVLSGGVVTLTCSISGHPIDSIVWTKNFRPLVTNERVTLRGKDVLHIGSVQKGDQGMYQCFVYSHGDSQQATAQLVVGDVPPVLHQTFPDRKVHPGATVSMLCTASGHPPPEVTWEVESQPLPKLGHFKKDNSYINNGIIFSYLNISNVRTQDGGLYQCTATNPMGSVTHSNRLDVYGSPFIRPMVNVSVVEGDQLIIKCPVSGYPIHSITWEKNGLQLPVTSRQLVFPNGTLIINQVAKDSDQGKYKCTARNIEGASNYQTVHVNVITPPKITPFDLPARVKEGSTIVLTCSVIYGDQPFVMKWLKNNRPLPADQGVTVQKHERFTILALNNVKPEHGGNYTCVISNYGGTADHSAILRVDTPPRWKVEPVNTSVVLGAIVTIGCSADGSPQPIVTWKKASGSSPKNFVPVYNSHHYVIFSNGSLMIRDATRGTGGFYLCQASNNVGADLSKLISLNVHAPPQIQVQKQVYSVTLGNKLELSCLATGDLPMDIYWTKDGGRDGSYILKPNGRYIFEEKNGDNFNESILFIAVSERNDTDRFSCHVTNKYGNATANFQVIVQEAPGVPSGVRIVNKTGRSLTLTWVEPLNGHSPITRYHIQYQQQDSGAWKKFIVTSNRNMAVIDGLLAASVYRFRVSAENSIGRSNYSLIINGETDEEVPGAPPLNVKVVATGPNSIKVTWEPPRLELWNGSIKGYYIGYTLVTSSEPTMYKTVELKSKAMNLESHLTNLLRSQFYSVSVQAFNNKGPGPVSDRVTVKTLADVPPTAPQLKVVSTTATSITFSWSHRRTFGSPVTDYVLYYREENKNWVENTLKSKIADQTYTLSGLECGTRYKLYMVSTNSVGRSEPSEILSVRTHGAAPLSPTKEDFIHRDVTFVRLNLLSWETGGCLIKEYSIKIRRKPMSHWTILSDHVPSNQSEYVLHRLTPGTWYDLLVTAYSSAGATEAMYEFQTFNVTFEEAAVPDLHTVVPKPAQMESDFPLLLDFTIIVPVLTSVVIVIIIITVGCLLYRHRNSHYSPSSEGSGSSQSKIRRGMETLVLKEIEGSNEQGCLATGVSSDEGTQPSSSSNSHSRPVLTGLSQEQELHPYALPYDTITVPDYQVSPSTSTQNTLNRRWGDAKGDNIYVSSAVLIDAMKP